MSQRMPRVTVTLSPETVEQLNWLQDRLGQLPQSAVIRLAIAELYQAKGGPPLDPDADDCKS